MASFQDRVIGTLQLQPAAFEEVENDATATGQAATVVALVAIARAIGGLGIGGIGFFVLQLVLTFIGWVIGAAVVWLVGTRLLPGKDTQADLGQMLRVTGFAQAANIASVFAIMPFLGWVIAFIASIWTLVALVIGVRQALDYDDTVRAIIVCVIAWAIMFVVTFLAVLMGTAFGMMTRPY